MSRFECGSAGVARAARGHRPDEGFGRRTRVLAGALAIALASLDCRGGADPGLPPATPSTQAAPEAKSASATTAPPSASASAEPSAETTPAPEPAPAPRPELPRGGRELFPAYRLAGFCGTPGAPALGRLLGNLPTKSKQLVSYADKYAQGRKVLPAFELIAVIVMGAPGKDGKWRRRVPDSVVDEYLQAARAAKGLLILNIQPGHSDFVTEVKHFEKYLRQPDVGVALDPEWAMKGKQKPGAVFGQTTGATINEVAAYLSGLVAEGDLPEKALVFHQVNGHVVKDESALVAHPGVAIIKGVDGLGPKASKIKTYNFLVKSMPSYVHAGFKLFFDEDKTNGGKLMTPEEVMALTPEPEYVMYE
ncbi:MAG: hypothetical protein KF764_22265 [Labilithrix sp.]|nr:hypothetical protein [Labilithrix sp.]